LQGKIPRDIGLVN